MHLTLFRTPVVNTVLRSFSVFFLRATGWKIEGSLPAGATKCVFIAAPHTSNWDLPYTLMVAFALRLDIYWMFMVILESVPAGSIFRMAHLSVRPAWATPVRSRARATLLSPPIGLTPAPVM